MIAFVQLSYENASVVKALSREDYKELREAVPTMMLPEWPSDKEEKPHWYKYGEVIPIELPSDAVMLAKHKIKYTIEKIKNSYQHKHLDASGNTYNLNFALPNIGLLSVDEVDWLDDACTQDVQRRLNEGWRIIAVCPPNGARRPDYIFGRSKLD